jgi:hypothetical protein
MFCRQIDALFLGSHSLPCPSRSAAESTNFLADQYMLEEACKKRRAPRIRLPGTNLVDIEKSAAQSLIYINTSARAFLILAM